MGVIQGNEALVFLNISRLINMRYKISRREERHFSDSLRIFMLLFVVLCQAIFVISNMAVIQDGRLHVQVEDRPKFRGVSVLIASL